MTLPPTEVPPSKRRTARTMSSPRAARERGVRRTRVGRRFARRDAGLDHNRRTPLSCSQIITPTPPPALLHVVRRPIDTRRDAAAVVTAPCLTRDRCPRRDDASSAPPLLHVHRQLACQGRLASNVGLVLALCLRSDVSTEQTLARHQNRAGC